MNRRILTFAALALAGVRLLCAQDADNPTPAAPSISTSASQQYPQVSCTSTDPVAITETLQLASETRDQLALLFPLDTTWRFAVHIRIMTPDDPLLVRVSHEAAAVFAQGNTMKIEAVLPSTDPDAREFIQRQFVTAILWEKFFANTKTFDKSTRLDAVPTWLVEGLRETLNDDPERNRESIVRRSVKNQSTPTLEEVTSWHELSEDRLLGLWQRAFCYYLVKSLTQSGEKLDDFRQWLAGSSGTIPTSPFHFPTDAAWQRELVDATSRSQGIVYTWSETLSQLTDAETITYAESKKDKVQTCALDNVLSLQRTPAVLEALKERNFLLTALELRAHPSWHAVLELYRSALVAIDANHPDDARKLLEEAHRESVAEMDNHQKLLDYVNWFEVTKDYPDNNSRFQRYFSTARSMQRAEADTAHPNPIRANLLEIEAHL
jgi:hypothetical protein